MEGRQPIFIKDFFARVCLLALTSSLSFQTTVMGFTLVSSNPPRYGIDEVAVDFTSDDCSNTGFTNEDLFNMAMEAMDEFWNKIPTSRIKMVKGSVVNIDSSADTRISTLAVKNSPNRITIGCNGAVESFSGGSTGAVGGVVSSGGQTYGAVILNAHTQTTMPYLSKSQILALMAHEIGHALGLGHSSDETAVMYYSIGGKVQEQLGQDDYDGLTYLYPQEKKLGGVAGSCATIGLLPPASSGRSGSGVGAEPAQNLDSSPLQNLWQSFMIGFLFIFLILSSLSLKIPLKVPTKDPSA